MKSTPGGEISVQLNNECEGDKIMWKLLGNSCCRARTEHNLAKTLTLKFILKFKLIAVIQTRII